VVHRRYLGCRSARSAGVLDRDLSFFSRLNPFVRGLLILAAIAGLVVVFQLERTLTALYVLARVAFILAIAYFIFLTWRERREGISMWSPRAQWVFYGAAVVAVADVGLYWYGGAVGYEVLAFVAILALCGLAMWRTWRDQHHYV
jgi:small-conductance mechanosensitive channel